MLSKTFKQTKKLVKSCDLFSTTELLRYNENPQYKSANGGLCSLAILVCFAIIFTQTILSTFQKKSISAQTTLYEETEPSKYSTENTPFLFAAGISTFNLNHPSIKYFNVEMQQINIVNGKKVPKIISLIPCQRSIWTDVDVNLGQTFDSLHFNQWLCLPQNATFEFQGKFTSSIFKYAKISVKDCSISGNDSRTCVNSSVIDDYINKTGPIQFNYYFLNTIINADNSDYLGFYLQDRNYFTFTKDLATSVNLFISSYNIQTDQSLWPIQSISQDNGGIVYENAQTFLFKPTNEYIKFYIRKSSLSLTIQRSFKKYDDTLSYIGGLLSTIMVCLFIMTKYNEYAYEIEIAAKIYQYNKRNKIEEDKFNLLTFFSYSFYCVLDFIGKAPQWPTMKQFDVTRQEIGKQLDLKLLLRKISFLEDCIQFLFHDFELQCLHLKGKMTLTEASKIRKRFSSRYRLIKIKNKIDRQKHGSDTLKSNNKGQIIKTNPKKVHHQNQVEMKSEKDESIENNKEDCSQISLENYLKEFQEIDSISQDSSEQNEKANIEFVEQCKQSISMLKQEARKGNIRCERILKSLDKAIIKLGDRVIPEINQTNIYMLDEVSPNKPIQQQQKVSFQFLN